jgi:hypothetical protein
MIAQKMVRLIETHSETLARELMAKILGSERMCDLHKVPAPELQQRVYEVYRNLNDWLVGKTDEDIERWYSSIGARRFTQGVALSHVVCALMLVKEHITLFLRREVVLDEPFEVYQELELIQLLDHFFDRAIYYAVRGYEQARQSRAA